MNSLQYAWLALALSSPCVYLMVLPHLKPIVHSYQRGEDNASLHVISVLIISCRIFFV